MAEGLSDRLSMPLLHAGQAHKEVFHNEALAIADMLIQASVETVPLATPPSAPVAGQCWLVGVGATGAWTGQGGSIAGWTSSGWRFCPAVHGMRVWVRDLGYELVYTGSAWQDDSVRPDGVYVTGQRVVTVRQPSIGDPEGGTVIDAPCRAAVSDILAMLRVHGLTD